MRASRSLPKIGEEEDGAVRQVLTRMLAVAWGLPVADSEPAFLESQHRDLLEVLIRLFADRLLAAVRRGLPHRYLAKEEDLTFLRGKLDVQRQLARHSVRPDRLACKFEELSVDTPVNRVLKAGVKCLASVTRSAANLRKLSELAARFEFVGDSPYPLRERAFLDRTNTAFHRLHKLACRLLAGDWQSTTTRRQTGFRASVSNERAVRRVCWAEHEKGARPEVRPRLQDASRHALDGPRGALFALKPDIIVDDDIVIDTKWKILNPDDPRAGVNQADVYQMMAYARAYDARRLVLLFPWHARMERPGIWESWQIAGTSTPFDIATVDVGVPNSVPDVLRQIVR